MDSTENTGHYTIFKPLFAVSLLLKLNDMVSYKTVRQRTKQAYLPGRGNRGGILQTTHGY